MKTWGYIDPIGIKKNLFGISISNPNTNGSKNMQHLCNNTKQLLQYETERTRSLDNNMLFFIEDSITTFTTIGSIEINI